MTEMNIIQKPFGCSLCEKSFSQPLALARHAEIYHTSNFEAKKQNYAQHEPKLIPHGGPKMESKSSNMMS